MTTYTLFEGRNRDDNSMVTDFRKLDRALAQYKKTSYPYALINEYEGTPGDTMANYIRTVAEKGA